MSGPATLRRKLQNSVQELRTFDWANINDPDTIGIWPGAVKLLLIVLLFAAALGAGYWFHIKNLQVELARTTAVEVELRASLENKAILAANLEAYRQQMVEMQAQFGTLLGQLPNQTEVPGLLEDITFTGVGSGLEFSSIQLQSEVTREFYVELPISIVVNGGYHDFGAFVSGVASLPRIVTLHDFNITTSSDRTELNMQITARTYRDNSSEN